jgi:hypothetical protein
MYVPTEGDFIRRVNIPDEPTHKRILATNPEQDVRLGKWEACKACDFLVFDRSGSWVWSGWYACKNELSLVDILGETALLSNASQRDIT